MEGTWGSPSGGCSSGACEPLGRSVHSVKGTDGDRVEEGGGRGRWGGGVDCSTGFVLGRNLSELPRAEILTQKIWVVCLKL